MRLIFLTVLAAATLAAAPQKKILIIAGEPSHGWSKHEFPAGAELLANALNASSLPLQSTASRGWPQDSDTLQAAAAIILYSDGLGDHVANGQIAALRAARENGAGIGILHFALEPDEPELIVFLDDTIGGHFEPHWSVNPIWKMVEPILSTHPVANGVAPFELQDEWYFHLKFSHDIVPILSAHPPIGSLGADGPRSGNPAVRSALENRIPQVLAWTNTDSENRRGFGFTGGHFHRNWANDSFRKLVLNGIAWTAGIEIPVTGVESATPLIVEYQTIDEAIARGDADDTARHLDLDPELLNRPGRGNLTPLQQAILRKKKDIAALLLERGADSNLASKDGQTPLHAAVSRGLAATVSKLLEHGADQSARDAQGWTPLHLAAAKDNLPVAQALIAAANGQHNLSAAGGTPLHEAAASGSTAMVQLLLDSGEDPAIISSHGKTALDIAKEYNNAAAIKALSR